MVSGKLLFTVVEQDQAYAFARVTNVSQVEPDQIAMWPLAHLRRLTGQPTRRSFTNLRFMAIVEPSGGIPPYRVTYETHNVNPDSLDKVLELQNLAEIHWLVKAQPGIGIDDIFAHIPTDFDWQDELDELSQKTDEKNYWIPNLTSQIELLKAALRGDAIHCAIKINVTGLDAIFDAVYLTNDPNPFLNIKKHSAEVRELARYEQVDTATGLMRIEARLQSLALQDLEGPYFKGNVEKIQDDHASVRLKNFETGEVIHRWFPIDRFNLPGLPLRQASVVECVVDREDYPLIRQPKKRQSEMDHRLEVVSSDLQRNMDFTRKVEPVERLAYIRDPGRRL